MWARPLDEARVGGPARLLVDSMAPYNEMDANIQRDNIHGALGVQYLAGYNPEMPENPGFIGYSGAPAFYGATVQRQYNTQFRIDNTGEYLDIFDYSSNSSILLAREANTTYNLTTEQRFAGHYFNVGGTWWPIHYY